MITSKPAIEADGTSIAICLVTEGIRREPERKIQKGIAMAFTIYSVGAASILLAAVIYVIVRRMWQD